jgi:hypothetical protein
VIHPAEQIRVESGRIVVAVDADIVEVSGHSPIMEAQLPAGMHLTQVTGEGLLDWTLAADHRLHLTWHRRGPVPRGHIHIIGWIPLDEDPLKIGNRQHRVRTPWIGWPGAVVSPGSLTIVSGTRTTLEGGTGLSPTAVVAPPEPSIGVGVGGAVIATGERAAAPAPARLSYQVNDPTRLGELSWDARPPRVAVVVESQLTIHSDFAQWVAVVRYDVAGGAVNEVDLRIPSAWAAGAKLHLSGDDLQMTARVVDSSAFWRVVPGRPLWGSHRFVLRSTLPLGVDREIVYPEVAPLGWGAVDAYLGIVNATGHPLASPDATGLKPLAYATHFLDREFTRDAGTPAGAFHVEKEVWALRVQLPRNGAEPPGSRDDAARVALADVMLSVQPDRSIVGRALYEVQPDSGRLLNFELPPGSTILWAAVEPNPAVPLRSGPGVWSIVLEGGRQDRFCLVWKTPPTGSEPASETPARDPGAWPLALPRAGIGACPMLVTVSTPPGLAIEGIPSGFEPATMARLDKARADWLDETIRATLAKVDRSSGRDHERLVALLINHELALRAAEQAARSDGSGSRGGSPDQKLIDSIDPARRGILDAVRSAGLTDDLASAQGYLGLGQAATNRPPGGIPEPIAPYRIRAFGRPEAMLGVIKGLDETLTRPVLKFDGRPRAGQLEGGVARSAIMIAGLLGVALLATFFAGRRLADAAALLATLGIAGMAGGPVSLAGGLGLAALAWRNGHARREALRI